MIKSLRLVNFKNFADETLNLGPFTLIVGANASGKSNIRDALRFVFGVGSGYTLAEILGGVNSTGWEPIRGAANEIMRFGHDEFSLAIEIKSRKLPRIGVIELSYLIGIKQDDERGGIFQVSEESLSVSPKPPDNSLPKVLYSSGPPTASYRSTRGKGDKLILQLPSGDPIELASNQPVLGQDDPFRYETLVLNKGDGNDVEWTDELSDKTAANLARLATALELVKVSFLELSPERMREPCLPGADRLGNSGENLPAVLEAICADPKCKHALLSWLQELTPMDVGDLEFPVDFSGRVNLQIREANGQRVSAYSASDGTLRFLGILAALLSEDSERLYVLEEIDNGIHPARLHLLLDLIERQTAKGKIQVVATTHSPDVLNLINDTTFENAVVVYRDEDSADAVIRRVAELPNARELRKSQGLGRLHAGGWMENILSFAEAETED